MRFAICIFCTFLFAVTAFSQDPAPTPVPCPDGYVCLSRAAALKALEDSDARKVLETEKAVLLQAIIDLKKLVEDAKIEYIKVSVENTALKQQQVRDAAIIDLLLKSTRKRCAPFSICVGG